MANQRISERHPRGWRGATLGIGVVVLGLIASACGFPPPPELPSDSGIDAAASDAGGGDTTPPQVVMIEPPAHAASVDPMVSIAVTFSEPINIQSGPQFVVSAAGVDLQGTVTADGSVLTFRPSAALPAGSPLSVLVAGAADLAGNRLAAPYTSDFTTRTTLCVKEGGGGGCFPLPSDAINAAANGNSIAIAAGTYVDNLVVARPLNLLGGFNADFTTRDPATQVTTIRPAAPPSESRSIVDLRGQSVLLDGVTLTGGDSGGEHGGGLRVSSGTARIQNSVIMGNVASFTAGGIYIFGGVSVTLAGNRIENNTATGQDNCSGGGITVENSTVVLRDNVIMGNRVPDDFGSGGGIALFGSVATLVNNRIDGNHVGGAGKVGTGGGIVSAGSQLAITGGSLSSNDIGDTTGAGAGLHVSADASTPLAMRDARLDGVRLVGNIGAGSAGGASAIHVAGANLVLASSIVAANQGGTAAISGGPSLATGGPAGSTVIINCTIADNIARGITASHFLTVVNSAIVREPVGISITGSPAPSVSVRRNALFGNMTDVSGFALDGSNLTVDPQLDASFHLLATSPLVDAGQPGLIQTANTSAPAVDPPARDIDGDLRTMGTAPDIGADELRK